MGFGFNVIRMQINNELQSIFFCFLVYIEKNIQPGLPTRVAGQSDSKGLEATAAA